MDLMPKARTEGLIATEAEDDLLIYDLGNNRAHCLNQTAALVWRLCDGQRSAAQIAGSIRDHPGDAVDEDVVWMALNELGRSGLLQESVARSPGARYSRRDLLRKLGVAAAGGAVLLPAISSIVSPEAVQAASCGQPCESKDDCTNPTCKNCTGNPKRCT
jgi:hypothetical protein